MYASLRESREVKINSSLSLSLCTQPRPILELTSTLSLAPSRCHLQNSTHHTQNLTFSYFAHHSSVHTNITTYNIPAKTRTQDQGKRPFPFPPETNMCASTQESSVGENTNTNARKPPPAPRPLSSVQYPFTRLGNLSFPTPPVSDRQFIHHQTRARTNRFPPNALTGKYGRAGLVCSYIAVLEFDGRGQVSDNQFSCKITESYFQILNHKRLEL